MDTDILQLRKFAAPEIVFGLDAAGLAGRYARNFEAERVLVVTDPGVMAAGWTDSVLASLSQAGLRATVFSAVSPNPRESEVMDAAGLFMREGCGVIVAVGGGSPMDLAKGVGIIVSNGGHILDYEGADRVETACPPLVCLPTTSGSAADVSQFAIITDTARKVKIAIVSKTVIPDVALIDPRLSSTMDATLTAHTGLDALTHAVEAYVSNASSAVTDLFALSAVKRIAASLPGAVSRPDDLAARAGMSLACMEAGLAFSNAILGAVHAMAHSLGGFLDLPHGECNAILLPHVMDANYDAAPRRFRDIGLALGVSLAGLSPQAEREAVCGAVRAFSLGLGVGRGLAGLGVGPGNIPELAAKALADPCMLTNPSPLTQEEVEAIYVRAL